MQPVNPHTILIINIRLIGDVVLSTPLLDILASAYPDAKIDFLVNRGTGEFLEKDPRVRRVYYSEKWQRGASLFSNNYLAGLFRKYDMALSLNASDRACLAAVVAGRRTRVGYYDARKKTGTLWRRFLMNPALPYCEDLHVVMRCREVAEAVGLASDRLRVRLYWDSADEGTVSGMLAANDVRSDFFVVHPFARWRYKYWDIERFIELSDLVARSRGLVPVWTSSPDPEEVGLLTAAAQRCATPPLVVPGTLSLNQMACLIDRATLYLGLDTAISHIAASIGTPMVALYGPTEMWRWHPWDNESSLADSGTTELSRATYRSGHIVAMQAGCDHYPCIRPHCYGEGLENPCMMMLSVTDVFQEINGLLPDGGNDGNKH